MTLDHTRTADGPNTDYSIARSIHDDELDYFRAQYETARAARDDERCAYCGANAIAVDRSDFLVCAGHADMRTDTYLSVRELDGWYVGLTYVETDKLADALLGSLTAPVTRPCEYVIAERTERGDVECGAAADYQYTLNGIPDGLGYEPTLYCVHHMAQLLDDIARAPREALADWLADGSFSTLD